MPYLRDVMVAAGVLAETFETAITWERFPALHERVTQAAAEALPPSARGQARVNCRFTHVYPDGPAPYFTVIAPARRGEEVEQWQQREGRGQRRDPARGGDDHPPPRRRARSPALV